MANNDYTFCGQNSPHSPHQWAPTVPGTAQFWRYCAGYTVHLEVLARENKLPGWHMDIWMPEATDEEAEKLSELIIDLCELFTRNRSWDTHESMRKES